MTISIISQLEEKAGSLGFNQVGVIPAAPGKRLAAYLRWIEAQQYGEMGYLARPDRVTRRQDLQLILPGVQTIVCVALNYSAGPPPQLVYDPGRGRISNYAWGIDYHAVMTPRLQELADWLRQTAGQSGQRVESRVYVDTGAILERDHGETAVLGFTGKNSMLIHPRRGSYFFLGEILTTWEINPPPPTHRPLSVSCGICHRCLDACPTHAFPQPYVLDARRCISYLTIELKGWIPAELRPFMGNWVYGCDVCQEVCPFNRFVHQAGRETADSEWITQAAAPPLVELLTLTETQFQHRFAHSPIRRIKRGQLVRNACVAAGNWGSQTAVPVLFPLLADPDPIVRGHAAWALHRIGGEAAKTAVTQALITEPDDRVRRELAGE